MNYLLIFLPAQKKWYASKRVKKTPEPEHVHTFSEIDVKAIREATGLRQQDFAVAVGVSYDLVKSWETKRRQPTGAPRKLLLLLQANPFIINQLKTI
ncbi:transcriptional regulator [Escherichia coli]|nr:transcriptional regulator [Escherichia coli]